MMKEAKKEEVIEEYNIESDKSRLGVKIIGGKGLIKRYEVFVHELSPATEALLDEIKQELIVGLTLSSIELLDPKSVEQLKEKFRNNASVLLEKKLPKINPKTKDFLIGILLREMLGLGKIELLINDTNLEEIVIMSSKEPVRIYHKKYGWLETNIVIETETQIQNYAHIIARRVGRQITTLSPLLDANLVTGDRANAVLHPIATKGNTLTIRRFARDPWTVIDLIMNNTCDAKVFSLIWFAIQYECNVLISGGTASGKTSFLNVCMMFIPPNHRIISIEDTRELMLPGFLYWCPLITREPNPEGKGAITMLDLLVNSLRMRPDRIILGEMRKKDQAEVLFEAMHTGHSVYATVHADSMSATIQRLINPPIEVPSGLLGAVNLNVVMFRERRRGIRRVYQIGEFISGREENNIVVKPNVLYRWKPDSDKIVQHAKSLKLFDDLSRHTGMTLNEMNKDLLDKQKILGWMIKRKIRDMHSVGKVIREYYINPENVIRIAAKNMDPKLIGIK
ncbi:MAG: CpaF family protein [Nanoarchaeota archaeon]|nr:CpaF family protein [Nanoarchaeota archaeon]